MCLILEVSKTREVIDSFFRVHRYNSYPKTFYKVYLLCLDSKFGTGLVSIRYASKYDSRNTMAKFGVLKEGTIVPGVIKSDREEKGLSVGDFLRNSVDHGIRVFLDEKSAKNYVTFAVTYFRLDYYEKYKFIVVPVECKFNNLVAAGHTTWSESIEDFTLDTAVFMEVELLQEDYDKVIKENTITENNNVPS